MFNRQWRIKISIQYFHLNTLFKLFFAIGCTPLFAEQGYIKPWGKDRKLAKPSYSLTVPKKRNDPLSSLLDGFIAIHQNHISPLSPPRSSYKPSSSMYMRLAIRRYGPLKGVIMGLDRLMRENGEDWVYRRIVVNGIEYKYDPPVE